MTKRRSTFAAFVIALVLTTPALGGIIHSDEPSPEPVPTPTPAATSTTTGGATANGIIHSDVAGTDAAAADTLTATAVTFVQLVLSLF
jgi:hypothetical protein